MLTICKHFRCDKKHITYLLQRGLRIKYIYNYNKPYVKCDETPVQYFEPLTRAFV